MIYNIIDTYDIYLHAYINICACTWIIGFAIIRKSWNHSPANIIVLFCEYY